jgi:hypothetical protein
LGLIVSDIIAPRWVYGPAGLHGRKNPQKIPAARNSGAEYALVTRNARRAAKKREFGYTILEAASQEHPAPEHAN